VISDAIVDTGALVAFLDRAERHHGWIVDQIHKLDPPLLLCEPVMVETLYLLADSPRAHNIVFGLIEKGALRLSFRIEENADALRRLMEKYRDTPMSLADACIVRMAEVHNRHAILTLDSDFLIYRKHGRSPLTLIYPASH
jgi:predicted nucleic acid-binding protein